MMRIFNLDLWRWTFSNTWVWCIDIWDTWESAIECCLERESLLLLMLKDWLRCNFESIESLRFRPNWMAPLHPFLRSISLWEKIKFFMQNFMNLRLMKYYLGRAATHDELSSFDDGSCEFLSSIWLIGKPMGSSWRLFMLSDKRPVFRNSFRFM